MSSSWHPLSVCCCLVSQLLLFVKLLAGSLHYSCTNKGSATKLKDSFTLTFWGPLFYSSLISGSMLMFPHCSDISERCTWTLQARKAKTVCSGPRYLCPVETAESPRVKGHVHTNLTQWAISSSFCLILFVYSTFHSLFFKCFIQIYNFFSCEVSLTQVTKLVLKFWNKVWVSWVVGIHFWLYREKAQDKHI